MRRTTIFTVGMLALGVMSVGACGRAALEAYELDDGGEGGSGGDGSGGDTSTTDSVSQSSSIVSSSATMSTSSSNSVSSSTGPIGMCDFSGDCESCTQCAFQGPCQPLWQICFNSQPCVEFLNCWEQCQGQPGCFVGCAQNNEQGALEWLDAVQCMLCVECETDCQGAAPQLCQ